VGHRAQRINQVAAPRRFGHLAQQRGDQDKADGHQRRGAIERGSRAKAAQQTAQKRPHRDTQSQRGLVQNNGAANPSLRRADDHGQCGSDEQGVVKTSPRPETD